MVIVLNHSITEEEKKYIKEFLSSHGFQIHEIIGEKETILGAVGPVTIDLREVEILPGVQQVIPISKPYKLASREMKKNDTVIQIGETIFGGGRLSIIAGPCAVESEEQIFTAAKLARDAGASILRGGAYKPRTSPYSFQGLGEEGLKLLKAAGDTYGMPVVSEIVSPGHMDQMARYVDMFQVGARNMQNFELLKALGSSGRPVMLKRGLAATIEEWLMAAEYLMAHGSQDVLLCERGIRTFETYTRNSLDISSIPVVKKLSHLPVIVDPSHATGIREKVPPVALAAVAAGADGLMVEMHPDPERALSDGPQSLYPEQLEKLIQDVEALCPVINKELKHPRYFLATHHEGMPEDTSKEGTAQKILTIGYQGAPGAYSEAALLKFFSDQETKAVALEEFSLVFKAVLDGSVDFGIVPLENALTGSIHENFDLFLQFPDVKIAGETQIRIRHSLITHPDATEQTIEEVLSHPQGLAQCQRYLSKFPLWKQIPYYDTAGSVAYVAESKLKTKAAIAHARAADVYGLTVLKEGIETNPSNYTRFAILSKKGVVYPGIVDKASLVFATPDKPGALLECMKILSQYELNLKKLESRPIHGKPWTYMFYVDVEIAGNLDRFEDALKDLESKAEDLRVLGTYAVKS